MSYLKEINTFFGRLRGLHGDRSTYIVQSKLYECINCKKFFETKQQGNSHECVKSK